MESANTIQQQSSLGDKHMEQRPARDSSREWSNPLNRLTHESDFWRRVLEDFCLGRAGRDFWDFDFLMAREPTVSTTVITCQRSKLMLGRANSLWPAWGEFPGCSRATSLLPPVPTSTQSNSPFKVFPFSRSVVEISVTRGYKQMNIGYIPRFSLTIFSCALRVAAVDDDYVTPVS